MYINKNSNKLKLKSYIIDCLIIFEHRDKRENKREREERDRDSKRQQKYKTLGWHYKYD